VPWAWRVSSSDARRRLCARVAPAAARPVPGYWDVMPARARLRRLACSNNPRDVAWAPMTRASTMRRRARSPSWAAPAEVGGVACRASRPATAVSPAPAASRWGSGSASTGGPHRLGRGRGPAIRAASSRAAGSGHGTAARASPAAVANAGQAAASSGPFRVVISHMMERTSRAQSCSSSATVVRSRTQPLLDFLIGLRQVAQSQPQPGRFVARRDPRQLPGR